MLRVCSQNFWSEIKLSWGVKKGQRHKNVDGWETNGNEFQNCFSEFSFSRPCIQPEEGEGGGGEDVLALPSWERSRSNFSEIKMNETKTTHRLIHGDISVSLEWVRESTNEIDKRGRKKRFVIKIGTDWRPLLCRLLTYFEKHHWNGFARNHVTCALVETRGDEI